MHWKMGIAPETVLASIQLTAKMSAGSDPARPIRPEAVALADQGVIDDLPAAIPVSQCKLEVIETYVGDLLDGALGRPE
jgi:hypothetical protein